MKAHLTVRETPLREGEAVQTLCELTIYRAKILLLWDQIGMNSPLALSTLLCCRKCCEAYISAPPGRYVFGVCEEKTVGKEPGAELKG